MKFYSFRSRIDISLISLFLLSIIFGFILNSCDREITIIESPPPGEGKVKIESSPSNAKVYWEGYYTGFKTPFSIDFLDNKNHEFVLKLDYYLDTLLNINIMNDSEDSIFVDYLKNPRMYGSINCISNPTNAKILINDSSIGKTTPLLLTNIVPGKYKIKYTYPEYRSDSTEIEVYSSQINRTELTLQDTSIWVDYQAKNSGLFDDYLSCVAVDQNNIKWIGTLSMGVFTFDGKNWDRFNTSNSPLPGNKIQDIGIDPVTGKKWFCTSAGVGIYDGISWEVYTPFNSILKEADITSIGFLSNGKTILGTHGEGLAEFDGSNWQIFKGTWFNRNFPSLHISDIFVDNEGNLWNANLYKGINLFNGTMWYRYFYLGLTFPNQDDPPGFIGHGKPGAIHFSNWVKSVSRDAAGRVWIGHWGEGSPAALSMFDGNRFYDMGEIIEGADINCIFVDDHDNKWLGTESALTVFKEVSSRVVYLESNSGLTSNNITDVTQDKNGAIWISTFGGGLLKFKGEL